MIAVVFTKNYLGQQMLVGALSYHGGCVIQQNLFFMTFHFYKLKITVCQLKCALPNSPN